MRSRRRDAVAIDRSDGTERPGSLGPGGPSGRCVRTAGAGGGAGGVAGGVPCEDKAMSSAAANPRSGAMARAQHQRAIVYVVLSWLIPGLGYLLLRRRGRAGLIFASIGGMFVLGLLMQGHLYGPNVGNVLDILAWVGDLCCGGLYFVTQLLGGGVGNIALAVADYGTKFMVAAGLLNLLAASDVYDLAVGRKQ